MCKCKGHLFSKARAGYGVLTIFGDAKGVEVKVDGKRAGETPLTLEVEIGRHKVEVGGGKCWLGETSWVDVARSERKQHQVRTEKRPAGIAVSAVDRRGDAVEAEVYVDDVRVGVSPGRFRVWACAAQLVLKKSGQGRYQERMRLRAMEVVEIKGELR